MATKKIKVQPNQSIYDIAVQEYGSVEGVFSLIDDNPGVVTSLDVNLATGTILEIKSLPIDKEVLNYYKDNNITPVSDAQALLIDIEGDYNNDFNDDFS